MDDGNGPNFIPDSAFENFSGTSMDLDFMDELLYEGCWLETANEFNFLQAGTISSSDLNDPRQYFPLFEPNSSNSNVNSHQENYQGVDELGGIGSQNQNIRSLDQSGSFPDESNELGRRLWIAPTATGPSSPVRDRLMHAIGQVKECTKDRDVLIQIWVPVKKEGKNVLTTIGQPYLLDRKCQSLASYRNVSKDFQFPADEDSKELVGLPGRVFLRELPEWTPDVRFFRGVEYLRKSHAKQLNIRGSLAVPVFERGSRTCLGVIEVVTTTRDISYRPDLENVCKALEAVDLRSPQDFCPPRLKVCKEVCQAAAPEISKILESVCKAHRLPLALAWAPCFREGKGGCRHFDESYSYFISLVNSAYFVAERDDWGFYMACSEQYLSFGQGIVGRAFATNKQCLSTDVAAFSKTDYPLSHHAKMFGLHAAIAIPLQSSYAGSADFVLELFLPKDCRNTEEQKQMSDILPITVQQACQSWHVIMDKELEETVNKKMVVASDERFHKDESQKFASSLFKDSSKAESSWIARTVEAQQKGKGVSVSWDHTKEEPREEFKVKSQRGRTQDDRYHKQAFPAFGQFQQNSGPKSSIEAGTDSSSAGRHSLGSIKFGDKRRTKTEKTISLEVLRQHFAGSLKDAAKSIGVCPTTLKRICRQHGITRWPSRKIKKVGHSLKKLQLVIDSVQGAEGAIQMGSFYATFPELTSPNLSGNGGLPSTKTDENFKQLNPQPESGIFSAAPSALKSRSSSWSHSSGSSICCSIGVKQDTTTNNGSVSGDPLMIEDHGDVLKRTHSDAELHALSRDETKCLVRSQSHKTFGDLPSPKTLPPLPKSSSRVIRDGGGFRVKATFGADKIRFTLQPNWGFRDLQQETARRFNLDDISGIDLKYLDDDQEWVLLTCDADLEECRDVYKLSEIHTIKISLHQPAQPHLGSSMESRGPHLGSSLGTGVPF
ncbi:PREDICTED: protein NLP2-like isoform X2 [Populus euphratica]|uniref:Protein NLP2-like isoform X2 n=1 Tax=Populus euphratica TaxID=75702 RepID=A0AAJ6Y3I8_POPEU|nr:PREDICTED: protein NLP2-like isoform X2 [Populus euphratica]